EKYDFGSPYAVEILYRFSQYFGWAQRNYRYGPYTNDPRVIELIRMIGETFENRSKFPGDAFRFTIDERVSLGGAVVRRIGDETALIPTFESITLFDFQEEISNKSSKHTPLYQSKAVRSALDAIDGADRPEALEGFERLAVLQNLFVDLLTYLEGVEGFRVSIGARKRARLRGSSARDLPAVTTVATVLHQTPGRIRMGIPRLRWDEAYANRLQSLLETVDHVRSIRISVGTASVVINFSPEIPETEFARKLENTIEEGFSSARLVSSEFCRVE
ncbi:MAG: HMA2 domain-containing protein, partial [Syntrophobacteraceae bacterium]